MNLLNGRIITKDKILKLSAIIKAKEQKSADTGFSILIIYLYAASAAVADCRKNDKKRKAAQQYAAFTDISLSTEFFHKLTQCFHRYCVFVLLQILDIRSCQVIFQIITRKIVVYNGICL